MTKRHRHTAILSIALSLLAGTTGVHVAMALGEEVGPTASTVTTVSAGVDGVTAQDVVPSHVNLPYTVKPKATNKFWDAVAQCETAGNWQDGGKWSGGLGIYQGTWENYGGEEFAPSPGKATKEEQIIVAHRISTQGYKTVRHRDPDWAKRNGVPVSFVWDKKPVGFGGWGCYKSKSTGKYRMAKPKLFHYDPAMVPIVQYSFNQKGLIVKDLQTLVGVRVDGHYGVRTRAAHVKYLKNRNMSVAGVPSLPVFLSGSYPKDKTKRCPQWEGRLRYYGLEPVDRFSYIMWRESRCMEDAVSPKNSDGSRDYGLLQINSSWKSVTAKVCKSKMGNMRVLLNQKCNLSVAKYLLDHGGLGHWSSTSGRD